MDSAELTEWMAFANIEPLWGRRMDYLGALISCVAGNPWREEPLDLGDLMPEWEKNDPKDGNAQLTRDALALGVFAGSFRPGEGEDEEEKRPKRERPAKKPTHLRDPANDPRRKGK